MKTKKKKYSAFTMIEIIVAIVILAILAVAISFAFEASVDNYTANESMFKTMNMARQALNRITTQIRSADFVALSAYEVAGQLSMTTAEGQNVCYEYRDADDSLYLIDKDVSPEKEYLLCSNVTNMTITRSEGNVRGTERVKTVKITMTVTLGIETKTLAAAAVVRKNMD